jgi:hypothetical protein
VTDKQRIEELERAVHILAREQLNQSGDKPALAVVLRRYAPQASEQKAPAPA